MSVNKFDEKNYEFKEDSFNLVQIDKKIHDVKFETKATTFAKDALKRFVKNRSSVVGAIIIGLLLICSLLLPLIIPYDIKNNHNDQTFLPPKLFNAGTGWWDGTKKYYEVPWDPATESPAEFRADCLIEHTITDVQYTNHASKYASGGYYMPVSMDTIKTGSKYDAKNVAKMYHYTLFNFKKEDNLQIKLSLGNENNINNNKLAEYKIMLTSDDFMYDLTDWSTNYSDDIVLNLNDALVANNLNSTTNANIIICMTKDETYNTYLLIKSLLITTTSEDEKLVKLLDEISISDAAQSVLLINNDDGSFPIGYWGTSFRKEVYNAEIRTVDFVYDEYKAKLNLVNKTIGGSEMQKYIENGWVEYDFEKGPESFKILNEEKSPVKQVFKSSYNEELNVYNIECEVYNYRYLGYDSMPRYIFGTTSDGKDIVKLSFNSLRTSLLIAILVAAVCFTFGICWGSISGYFGGNVDLAMERFCEILSGVPYIVVMTLVLLLLGNSIGVFAFGLCITGWMGTAARTRTQFYRFKGREYVLASRTLGASDKRLIFKHILPNALGTIVTSSILMVPSVIFSEATLAYLNLGLKGVDSFGVLLSNNQQHLSTYPMLIIFPAIIISLLMISFNLFGNGLRDALNPSLKGSE